MSRYVELEPPAGLHLRSMREQDLPFLRALYASTRADELRPVPWSDEQKAAFLDSQFALQHRYYQDQYPDARFDVVEHEGEAIGRLYLSQSDELRIIDIALVPAQRGRGFGSALLERIFVAARKRRSSVSIHVERMNPALRLYQRLGFELREDKGVYLFLVRPPHVEMSA